MNERPSFTNLNQANTEINNIQNNINELNKSLPLYKQIQNVKFRDTEFVKTTTKKIKRYIQRKKK